MLNVAERGERKREGGRERKILTFGLSQTELGTV